MLVASEVLPMPGRPARIRRSEGCKPAQQRVDIGEARGDAGNAPAAGLGLFRHFHRAAQASCEIERPLAIFASFR